MKRIMPLNFRLNYINASDSEERLQRACNRIFAIAKQNLQKKRQLKQGVDNNIDTI
jgi:hypothetical protein